MSSASDESTTMFTRGLKAASAPPREEGVPYRGPATGLGGGSKTREYKGKKYPIHIGRLGGKYLLVQKAGKSVKIYI